MSRGFRLDYCGVVCVFGHLISFRKRIQVRVTFFLYRRYSRYSSTPLSVASKPASAMRVISRGREKLGAFSTLAIRSISPCHHLAVAVGTMGPPFNRSRPSRSLSFCDLLVLLGIPPLRCLSHPPQAAAAPFLPVHSDNKTVVDARRGVNNYFAHHIAVARLNVIVTSLYRYATLYCWWYFKSMTNSTVMSVTANVAKMVSSHLLRCSETHNRIAGQ